MNCFKFANTMNNTMIINIFNNDNSSIPYIKTSHSQIMATIAYIALKYIALKFESMIKNPKLTNHTFFAVVIFSKIISFNDINSIVLQHL